MNEDTLRGNYIPRTAEERQIRREAAQVRKNHKSRAVLLYGPGGIGKTSLVRQLGQASSDDEMITWLDPIDVDDSEYWLLSNLERQVAQRLDPENHYFGAYLEYLSRLPSYTQAHVGHETVVSHLGRIKRVFVECYSHFVQDNGTVVIVFDTVEAIRGMYLLLTLTQWMKALPDTLFILSGRPLPGNGDAQDPIKNELEDPHQGLPVTTIFLSEFTEKDAFNYLDRNPIASGLDTIRKSKLARLTRGHPLWLAFTVSYLEEKGIPEEANPSLAKIKREIPFRGDMTSEGQSLHEAFKRRLVTPYRESDFWHEAVKRLAVVRQGVNRSIWQRLMDDRPLPEDVVDLDDAWEMLLKIPWIRPRANRHYVTLHDAVAEELARRIIPLHDQDRQWRHQLWQRASNIYGELTERRETELVENVAALDERLQFLDTGLHAEGNSLRDEEGTFIQEAARLDLRKRELDQFKAARLFYQLLGDFAAGSQRFVELLEQANKQHDVLFQDLLALEMQRFLPGGPHRYAFGDVIGDVIDDFRRWLSVSPELYLEIGLSMADYLIRNEQPEAAIEVLDEPTALLNSLQIARSLNIQRYRRGILLGNAYMRIPGRVKEGLPHLRQALEEATALKSADRQKLIAAAYKELGFYYRNEGMWREADESYRQARDAISVTLSARSSNADREEMASIQTNWAYVKGLVGSYRDGSNLVESAITVRHRLKELQEEGISWSVCGEVYRYERRFRKAWNAYAEAEQIFHGQRDWPWLGLIYQEQAICLFQATEDGINLIHGQDPNERAKRLITVALDICRDQNIRVYPSALNRAGRIFGQEDLEAGLGYLAEGIDSAYGLSDGWFWFANLIEYVELRYRAWIKTRRRVHFDEIASREGAIRQAMAEYEFPDLRGRWYLLQGNLGIRDWTVTDDESQLNTALENYKKGFGLIALGYVGSSGASNIPSEFRKFKEHLALLTPEIRRGWYDQLRDAWSDLQEGSTLLLARLEELY